MTGGPGTATGPAVAVTAVACRFPGAPDADAFWRLLIEAREGLTRFTDEDLAARGVPRRVRRDPAYVPVGGLIDGQDLFDPAPFGFTDAEAALLDPQQRLFLECAWQALERGGHGGGRDAGAVGVFAGAAHSAYLTSNLAGRWDPTGAGPDPGGSLQTAISTHTDYLPLQVAYRLGLTGPAIAVNTTCSTSLVAVHLAVQSLLTEECDTALAGGTSLIVPQGQGYRHVPDGIFSVDGRVRPFSADGTGIVYSQGVGVVVLRRLADALADGDPVLAVVHGTAVNNDGADKAGFTAPSVRGQARVIAEALAVAGVAPTQVGYVEAHGTATRLGDPVEVTALRQVFGSGPAWCGLGSVKSTIGHANTAAGIAAFIKTVLARQHGVIPASLHARPINELLGLDGSPFEVATETRPWPDRPYAGVSSFGIGGTNCHVVLGPAPEREPSEPDPRPHLLVASGHDADSAQAGGVALAEVPADRHLADVAHTLARGRVHGPHRVAVVAGPDGTRRVPAPVPAASRPPRLVFAFPGAGSAFPGMGSQLYAQEPGFAAAVDECADLLAAHLGRDVRVALRPDADPGLLADAAVGLPATFAVSVATARLLADWGVHPDTVLGHSVGEYAAAVTAGVLTLPDAARLVAVRCREVARAAAGGGMLAVALPAADVSDLLAGHPELDLSVVNAPDACVVSGPSAALDAFAATLPEVRPVRLRVDAALHSRLVEPALPPLAEAAAAVTPVRPRLSYASTVTGALAVDEVADRTYWVRQLRAPVLFSAALRAALNGIGAAEGADTEVLFVQVGPGTALVGLARRHRLATIRAVVPTMPSDEIGADAATLREALGALWCHGAAVDPAAGHGAGRRRVTAPGYAFQRRRFWIDPDGGPAVVSTVDVDEPIQVPVWQQAAPPAVRPRLRGRWLVAPGNDDGLTAAVCAAITAAGATAQPVSVRPVAGRTTGAVDGPEQYGAVPSGPEADDAATGVADADGMMILPGDDGDPRAAVRRQAEIARLLASTDVPVLVAVTRRAVAVLPDESPDPAQAAALVLPRVIAQERRGVRWSGVDVGAGSGSGEAASAVVAHAAELADNADPGAQWAVRGGRRWLRALVPWRPDPPQPDPSTGTVLILGGLGAVGTTIAGHFAAAGHHVVVTSRHGEPAPDTDRGRALVRARTTGAPVSVRRLDATDAQATTALLGELSGTGPLALVVHAAAAAGEDRWTTLRDATDAQVAEQLAAKLDTARSLRQAVAALPPDRRPPLVLLMSSVATLIGGVGTGPYAAANAALEAYAADADTPECRWLAVAWDAWRTGAGGPDPAVSLQDVLDAPAGLAAMDRVRAARTVAPSLVAVSPRDLPAVLTAAARSAAAAPPGTSGPVAAMTATEEIVARLWARLTGEPVAGPDADFFALGGHSLLATRMLAQLREQTGVGLRLADLLAHPTVGGLAALCDVGREAPGPRAVDIPPPGAAPAHHAPADDARADDAADDAPARAEDGTFPLTRIQHAYWVGRSGGYRWGDRACHFYLEYDCPELDLDRYERAWRTVIDRHPMLRAVVTGQGRMRVLDDLPAYRVRVHDLTIVDEAERTRRLAALRERISRQPGPPDRWPLFTVQAARLPGGRVRLFVGVDALVCDAASWWLIDRELRAFHADSDAALAPPAVHPADCVAAIERRRAGSAAARDAAWWRARLPELPPAPRLPVTDDPPEPPRFVRRTARLAADEWDALRAQVARRRLTPTAVLLATYADVLRQWSGDDRFSLMLTLFDRPDELAGAHGVVGDFTSLVVHEVAPAGSASFADRAAAVQRRLFADLDHRGFSGLDVLAEVSARTGEVAAVPVVFTSALGMAELIGEDHDLQWAGQQVYGVSQTPQTLLDHQALEQGGELWLQWDAIEPVLDPAQVQQAFDSYVDRVRRLATDPHHWESDRPSGRTTAAAPPSTVPYPLPDVALPVRAGSGPLTLWLMHPSGGDVLCYTELSRLLDERISVVALTDPALVGAPPPGTVAELAATYLAVLRERQPDGPLLLGGWSMGGTVAHEMARQAHAQGRAVPLLAMIDSNDPAYIRHLQVTSSTDAQVELIVRQFGALEAYLGVDLGGADPDLRARLTAAPEGDRLAEAEGRLRRARLLGRGESLRDRLAVLDRHLCALATHRPGRLPAADTTTLLVRATRTAPRNSGIGMGVDDTPPGVPDLGWRGHLARPPHTVDVDAHHYSVLRPPAVTAVAAALDSHLRALSLAH
ncbi:SDR family NAD(P)-dependent oxidoreductase [Micromonospora coxensis]|uniref:SDR family NAD(P)-dependent oxidoreductase n=1 Tax=Micromonospora coxensis TaxID=356852 RepID=UPI003421C7B7